MTRPRRVLLAGLVFALAVPAAAQAPERIAYQGVLTDLAGVPVPDGNYVLTFRLYSTLTGGTALFAETHLSVPVAGGVFAVELGSVTSLAGIAFDAPRYLSVQVGADPELAPRTALLSSPSALSLRNLRVVPQTATEGPNLIGGWSGNTVAAGVEGATIAGGGDPQDAGAGGAPKPNTVQFDYGTIGGGYGNTASFGATIGGGVNNTAVLTFSTVAGGANNRAGNGGATVGGGGGNTASGGSATVAGGSSNTASGFDAAIGGGSRNRALGHEATVPGGEGNHANGRGSFAAGYHARALHEGAFVWNDRSVTTGADSLVSTGNNQFLIRAAGGVAIGTDSPRALLTLRGPDEPTFGPHLQFLGTASDQVESGRIRFVEGFAEGNWRGAYVRYDGSANRLHIGVHEASDQNVANDLDAITVVRSATHFVGIGRTSPTHPLHVGTNTTNGNGAHVTAGGTWTNGSSRAFKEAFAPVDAQAVLASVAALPVARWRYRGAEGEGEHMGPVAEDFAAAFGLGSDARYIATVDADGVALAAIQGLLERVEALEAESARQRAEVERLRAVEARLAALEARLDALAVTD